MKIRKRWIALILLLIISLVAWDFLREKIYVGDSDFILHENVLSPDGKHRMIEFEIDHGAFGSHWGTSITPPEVQDLNLASYKIPRCYEAFGWTEQSELIVAVNKKLQNTTTLCEPKQYELKTGDTLLGAKVQVVDADEFLLKQGIIRTQEPPPNVEKAK